MFSRTTSRRVVVVFKASFHLLLAILSTFLIWWEFEEIFQSRIFIMLLVWWFAYAVIFFMDEWRKTKDDTLENKIDILMQEIRQDRNERKNHNGK